MTIAFRSADNFAAHAVCMAAGIRDGLRAAQFYIRDLSRADDWGKAHAAGATFLSVQVARLARLADRLMTWSANLSIRLFLPGWRELPSPFAPGMMSEVAAAIRRNSFVQNPLFNAYFFRAANHILQRYYNPPTLVLEHRVDAARRLLAARGDAGMTGERTDFLAHTLLALIETGPVARIGRMQRENAMFDRAEPNVVVWSIACVTLLFAEEGKPTQTVGDDQFFEIVGALIEPRLETIAALAERRDEQGLARELSEIRSLY